MRKSLALLAAIALLSSLSPAHADVAPPGLGGDVPGWFVPLGLNVGGSAGLGDRAGGFLMGGELSVVYLFGTPWAGIWADALYAFGADRPRLSVGFEAGWFILGAELGYTAELTPDGPVHGFRAGIVVTGGLVGAYFRWRHALSADGDDLEIGLLLKWPFQP